jgi:hypothetical protein
MTSLGIETMPEPPSTKKKSRWNTLTTIAVGAIIAAFLWVVFSNLYLLYAGKPLINLQH